MKLLTWVFTLNPLLGGNPHLPAIVTLNGLVSGMEGARARLSSLEALNAYFGYGGEGKPPLLAIRPQQEFCTSRTESYFGQARMLSAGAMQGSSFEAACAKINYANVTACRKMQTKHNSRRHHRADVEMR